MAASGSERNASNRSASDVALSQPVGSAFPIAARSRSAADGFALLARLGRRLNSTSGPSETRMLAEQFARRLKRQQVQGDGRMPGDLDLGYLQPVGGKVAAQRFRQGVFRLRLDRLCRRCRPS